MTAGVTSRAVAIGSIAVAFFGVLMYAIANDKLARHDSAASQMASEPANAGFTQSFRPALTAEEERFAGALWEIHESVKLSAARMSFAGLYYKIGDIPKEEVKIRVEPLTKVYRDAAQRARTINTPASFRELRDHYVEALRLYEEASIEMLKVAERGNDEHLIAAQSKSEKASTALLEVGNQLWPGEYKPN